MKITEIQIKDYRLVLRDNGWYYSQQGLILIEDGDVDVYLSKVFKMNEEDDKVKNLRIKLDTHYGKN